MYSFFPLFYQAILWVSSDILFFYKNLSEITAILVAFLNNNQSSRSHMTKTWLTDQEPRGPKNQKVQ